MAMYDLLGNIAIVKFRRETKKADKITFARELMKQYKQLTTVVEKVAKFKGRLRTLKTQHIFGEKTLEALYRENGCEFRLNIEQCYFSPRLAGERNELATLVKKGEHILVMFGGVAPFAIVLAKKTKAAHVVSVELGKLPTKYANENIKRNKVGDRVSALGGDVRRIVPKMGETFDRVVMARPNLKDSFLDVGFKAVKNNGIIHYYGFYEEEKLSELKDLVMNEAKKAKKKIKILGIKKAGDIGVRTFRYRVDIRITHSPPRR